MVGNSTMAMQLTASSFTTSVIQVSVFCGADTSFTPPAIVVPALQDFPDLFGDGEIVAVPLPDDGSETLPRVVISSKDERWKLQGGAKRIDCLWTRVPSRVDTEDRERNAQLAWQIIRKIVENSKVIVRRCAFVTARTAEVPDLPAFVRHFCNESVLNGPLKRSESFEIHNHKRYQLNAPGVSLEVNSWVRCKAHPVAAGKTVATIGQDLNTLPERINDQVIEIGELDAFFGTVLRECDQIVDVYFPTEI